MAEAYVLGVQGEGVISTVKHFALNNQEEGRLFMDVRVDEATMRHLYLPAFEAAVRAGTWSIMTSYNRVNGRFASESDFLLTQVLKNEWGFRGFAVSDWGATSLVTSASAGNAGLDLEMPWAFVFGAEPMQRALASGELTMATVDDKIRRQLRAMMAMGLVERAPAPNVADVPQALLDSHREIALEGAREGLVLLKNTGALLPFEAASLTSVAVIGPGALDTPISGGGSARVNAWRRTSIADGLRELLLPSAQVVVERGDDLNRAATLAAASDAVVLVVGWNADTEGEGKDRASLRLPGAQAALIEAVLAANPRAAIVINSGGSFVEETWLTRAPAVLQAWYLGQEGGRALAEALLGLINPSGRLPISFARSENDLWTHGTYPYDAGSRDTATYSEGLNMGYRHFRHKGLSPLFAFGHGLSYTRFSYTDLRVTRTSHGHYRIHFTLANTGPRDGTETAQLYAGRLGELQRFEKIWLRSGERRHVEWELPSSILELSEGLPLRVGPSSEDTPLLGKFPNPR
jgi:beta-glucosidase